MDRRVEKVVDYMREELSRPLTITDCSASVNLSPSRLAHIFKAELSLPPAKYLRSIRMQQAKALLETSFLSVKEVMFKIGVSDKSHFTREFKRTYGVTPSQCRARGGVS
jgi:AraC-like DNA-binding protein